ncbi:MAG TPA: penicillin acylase family protein, partial [Thermoanaerobaculia bacterium]
IAWGFTVFGIDQQDLYVEKLDPSDPNRYATETGWESMRVETEEIRILGGQKLDVAVKWTRHGPVVWDDGRRALALRWVGAEPGTAPYLGSLALDRAESWQDFLAAMERWKVPSENIVYADARGNIGELSAGLAPIRKGWTGLLPVAGTGSFEWNGFLPTSRLPRAWNPSSGFIATANHKMVPEAYPYAIGFEWAPPYRFDRIVEVLRGGGGPAKKLTFEDMERLQGDVVSLLARDLVRLLGSAAPAPTDPAARLLASWNGSLDRDSAAAALYETWVPELRREVARRIAPKEAWDLVESSLPSRVWLRALRDPQPEAFGPSPREERDRLLRDTVEAAAAKLRELSGNDPAGWSWGKLHSIRFRHPLHRAAGAESILDLPPVARPGDGTTVNATAAGSGFEQRAGASFREILDPLDWDRSVAVNAPGQSGQPASPHYADLLSLWSETRYFPLLYTKAAVERETVDRLVLEPDARAGVRR